MEALIHHFKLLFFFFDLCFFFGFWCFFLFDVFVDCGCREVGDVYAGLYRCL